MLIELRLKATKGKNKKTEILTSGFNHKMWEDKSVEENYKGFCSLFLQLFFLVSEKTVSLILFLDFAYFNNLWT